MFEEAFEMVFQWRLALPSQGRRLVGSVPDSLIWSVWILRVLPIDIGDGGCWKKKVFRIDGCTALTLT